MENDGRVVEEVVLLSDEEIEEEIADEIEEEIADEIADEIENESEKKSDEEITDITESELAGCNKFVNFYDDCFEDLEAWIRNW